MKSVIAIACIALALLSACGNKDNPADSITTDISTLKSSSTVAYDASRAHTLCDKYNAGLLTEKDYSEMLDMIQVAYTARFQCLDSLISASQDADSYRTEYMVITTRLDQKYPYASFLATICDEAEPDQMGQSNTVRLDSLKQNINSTYLQVSKRLSDKFHDESIRL